MNEVKEVSKLNGMRDTHKHTHTPEVAAVLYALVAGITSAAVVGAVELCECEIKVCHHLYRAVGGGSGGGVEEKG